MQPSNTNHCNFETISGITMVSSFVHLLNTLPPMLTKLSGNVIDFKLEQFAKTPSSKAATVSGIETVVKLVQPKNVL